MLELYIIATMTAIGYILSKTTLDAPSDKKSKYPNAEKPSMDDVYNSTYSDETLRLTALAANDKFIKSQDPKSTGIINKNYPLLKENKKDIDQNKIKSLNGNYIDRAEFTHNNMTPFFGAKKLQNVNLEKYANSSILLNHIGTDDLYQTKKEVKSFYDQCQNIDNINGSANNVDYYRDRVVQSKMRNNDFPVPQVHVGPGINRGFSSQPTGGYQQIDMRDYVMPKTVDDLRVESKPKTTFEGVVIDGQKGSVRGDLGIVNKNRPDTFFEQTPDMWLKTTGAITKQMDVPEQLVKVTNRQDTTSEYMGAAYGQDQIKRARDTTVRTSRRPILENFDVGNASLSQVGKKDQHDYGKANILVYENERDLTSTRVYQGNLTTLIKSIIAPITDMIKITKKEDSIDNPRHFGNMNAQIPQKATIYDPNDIARTTLKEQLIHDSSLGNLKGSNKRRIYDPNDIARTTLKEQLIHDSSLGNLKGSDKSTIYDPNNIARTTLKEQLIHDSSLGNLKGSDKSTIYDPNDIARTTLKEQLIHDSSYGNLKGSDKSTIYDPNDIARTTLKEQLIHDSSYGNLKGSNKRTIYDPNDIARSTLKEQLLQDSCLGNLKGSDKSTIYDPNDIARTTLKEQLIHDSSLGNLKGSDKSTIYDPNDIARTTLKEQLIHDSSLGNLKGSDKSTIYDPNDIARTTIKEQLIHDSSLGNLKGFDKNIIYDPNDIARTTLKEQLIHDTTINNLSGPVQLTIYDPEDIARTTGRNTMDSYDTSINLKGRSANQIYSDDPARATLAETLIDMDRNGNPNRENMLAGDAYDFVDWNIKMTQKQYLSDNDYYGSAITDKGSGYITNEYDARPTQKEILSDNDFFGIATANTNKKSISTDNAENMTTRPNIESVLRGRDPTQTGNKTYNAVECVNIIHKKNECDVKSVRNTPNTDKVYNVIPSTEELEITKMKKNYRQYDNERLDISILKATLDNPLNIDIRGLNGNTK